MVALNTKPPPSDNPGAPEDAEPDTKARFRTDLRLTPDNAGKPGMDTLESCYAAFERGDYPTVRKLALSIEDDASASQVAKDGAHKMLAVVNLDRTSLAIVAACSALFITILFLVY